MLSSSAWYVTCLIRNILREYDTSRVQKVLQTEVTEDWHLATALVTVDAVFAALSVKYVQ